MSAFKTRLSPATYGSTSGCSLSQTSPNPTQHQAALKVLSHALNFEVDGVSAYKDLNFFGRNPVHFSF